jgi:hypothetical protein
MIYADEDEYCRCCGQLKNASPNPAHEIQRSDVLEYVFDQLLKEGLVATKDDIEHVLLLICEYVAIRGGYFYGD